MRPASIADGDVGTHGAGNPFRAGHERKYQAHPAQVRPDALGASGVRIRNPHVDVDVAIETIRQRDQIDTFRHDT